MPHAKRLLLIIAAVIMLPACNYSNDLYRDRRDQVTFGSGDAVAANKAMQIIDPWPRHAQNIEQTTTGEEAEAALEKHRRRLRSADPAAVPAVSAPVTTPTSPIQRP